MPQSGIREALRQLPAAIDAVEFKATVADRRELAALNQLGLAVEDGEPRQVWFFETSDLALAGRGVVLRARRIGADKVDSTVKLRPVLPERVARKWRDEKGFKIEADIVGERMVVSASFTVQRDGKALAALAAGGGSIDKMFSGEQEDFLDAMAPVNFGTLRALGPVDVRRWEWRPDDLEHALCVEFWRVAGGPDLVELSIKADPDDARAAHAAFNDFLRRRDIPLDTTQATKTRAVLAFLAERQG